MKCNRESMHTALKLGYAICFQHHWTKIHNYLSAYSSFERELDSCSSSVWSLWRPHRVRNTKQLQIEVRCIGVIGFKKKEKRKVKSESRVWTKVSNTYSFCFFQNFRHSSFNATCFCIFLEAFS